MNISKQPSFTRVALACAAFIAATTAHAQSTAQTDAPEAAAPAMSISQPTSKLLATPVLGAVAARLLPDLAFDEAKMLANARGGASGLRGAPGDAAHVKNVGLGASKPTIMSCTDVADWADTQPGPNMGKLTRRTTTWSRNIPALARGQTYSDQVEMYGNNFIISRNCTIDPQQISGEANRANNTFSFSDFTAKMNASESPALRKPSLHMQPSPTK